MVLLLMEIRISVLRKNRFLIYINVLAVAKKIVNSQTLTTELMYVMAIHRLQKAFLAVVKKIASKKNVTTILLQLENMVAQVLLVLNAVEIRTVI